MFAGVVETKSPAVSDSTTENYNKYDSTQWLNSNIFLVDKKFDKIIRQTFMHLNTWYIYCLLSIFISGGGGEDYTCMFYADAILVCV